MQAWTTSQAGSLGIAHWLSEVLTDIFNTSDPQVIVPTCPKTATIISIPKHSTVLCLNGYPLALIPIIMKSFKWLVIAHMKTIDVSVDPNCIHFYIGGPVVELVFNFKYLGVHIFDNRLWSINTASIVKKAN